MDDQIKAIYEQLKAANPRIKINSVNYRPSSLNPFYVFTEDSKIIDGESFDLVAAQLAAMKVETEEEKTRRELLELENKANELRKKLGVE